MCPRIHDTEHLIVLLQLPTRRCTRRSGLATCVGQGTGRVDGAERESQARILCDRSW